MIYALYTALLEHFYGRLSYILKSNTSLASVGNSLQTLHIFPPREDLKA